MGLARSFQRGTESRIKVLRYWKALQWGGAKVNSCVTRATLVTRTGTYCPGRAPLRGCTGYTWSYMYSIHSITTEWWAMSHSDTPPVWNQAPLTARSSSLRCEWLLSTTLKNSSPKWTGQNPKSISQEAIYHETLDRTSSRYQVFEKLFWKLSEDASQRSSFNWMSLPI